ncbi:MAG: penicillin-binding protein activator [Pseudomonadota bacterium]
MLRRSRFPALAALVACMFAVAACGGKTSSTGPKASTANTAPTGEFDPTRPTTLAFLAPLTAENTGAAQLGQALANSARLATGELADPLIDLRVYDTGGRPELARAAVTRAIGEGARLIMGPLFSTSTRAVAAPAAEKGLKVISFSTDSSIAGGPVYLSGFLPDMETRRITSFARAQGYDAIGIFYPKNAAGELALSGARAGAGQGLAVRTPFERSEQGIGAGASEFAARARGSGVRAVLIPESGQALSFISAQLDQAGVGEGYKFLGNGQWNSRATLGATGVRGGWFPAPDPAAMKAFVSRYRATYGSVPPPLAVLGYDAVQVASQMLIEARATGSRNPFGQAALTRPQGYSAATGPIRFGPDGRSERGLSILEVGEAVFNVIDPAPIAFGVGS